jgi:hypothetical protein
MNSDGTNQTRLTNNTAQDSDASWSPDGAKIVFDSYRNGNFDVFVMNPDGTGQVALTNNADDEGQPAWSPDGKKIAYTRGKFNDLPTFEIYVMRSDGSNQVRLTVNLVDDEKPAWQPVQGFTVTNTNDAGAGSLRAAITSANQTPGPNPIAFNIPVSDPGFDGKVFTIKPLSALPTLTDNETTIDGDTQTDFTGDSNPLGPEIVLNGGSVGFVSGGLVVSSSGNIINALVSNGFNNTGIDIVGPTATFNSVTGCYLGTDRTGTSAVPNTFDGLALRGAASGNVIGGDSPALRNLISGNVRNGITIQDITVGGGANNNTVQGNFIGVDATGKFALPNGQDGIQIGPLASGNLIGGTNPLARNIISGNINSGVGFSLGNNIINNRVQGNFIGTNVDGVAAIPNHDGIGFNSTSLNAIGGTTPGARNIISGNNQDGIICNGCANQIIQGNYIGTDVFGTTALPNGAGGVIIVSSPGPATNNVIGGTLLGAGNLISGNATFGVQLTIAGTSGNVIQGNRVGLDANGGALGNNGTGISLVNVSNNQIGGLSAGAANIIAANTGHGVFLANSGSGNSVLSNSIFANGLLGIQRDAGVNNNQAAPIISAAAVSNGLLSVAGSVSSAPGANVTVQVFANGNCDPSNFGEGQTLIASMSVLTDASGQANFNSSTTIPPGQFITATVTDSAGNSSAFSKCTPVSGVVATSISGKVTATNNAPLANVSVTLSGTLTRIAQTDVNGNYLFDNLTQGGNYSVVASSSYYVFTPPRFDFNALSGSQTANFAQVPNAVPAPTPPFSDDFNTGTRDATKWNIGTATQPAGAFDPLVTVVQQGGQLVITPRNDVAGLHYNGYVSVNAFDLTNGTAGVEVVQPATGGADTIFAIGRDDENFFRFVVRDGGSGPSLPIGNRRTDTGVTLLIFQVKVAGVLNSLSIEYNPVLHRFMRFRHEPATNSIVFETSPDNVNFTVQNRVVLTKGVSALTAELSAGTSSSTSSTPAILDNFSLVPATFQFSSGTYSASEGDGSIQLTVTRSGDTTNAGSVDFATSDDSAGQRTKYILTAGTLSFASGETSKTFVVLLEDNNIVDGNQTFNVTLSQAVGLGLNSPGRAIVTIVDNDTAPPTTNPLDDAQFFVKQHYYDFLSRIPDPSGLTYWTGQITQCGSDQACVRTKRVDVSNAFFYELEYQQTGSYAYRLYRAAYGNHQPSPNPDANPNFPGENLKLPSYAVFARDRAQVVGGTSLAQSQLDLANAFVQRPEFVAKYPASLSTAAQFVDAVLATIQNDLAVDLSSERSALITLFNHGGRGEVMYRLVDDNLQTNPVNNRLLIDAEYNRAFVATQYFGYLRRDADIGGLLFWLGQVSSAALRDVPKQHAMVCSFITSDEYQQRLSSVVTHHNSECPH